MVDSCYQCKCSCIPYYCWNSTSRVLVYQRKASNKRSYSSGKRASTQHPISRSWSPEFTTKQAALWYCQSNIPGKYISKSAWTNQRRCSPIPPFYLLPSGTPEQSTEHRKPNSCGSKSRNNAPERKRKSRKPKCSTSNPTSVPQSTKQPCLSHPRIP